jgi:hypothetical protein
MQNRSGSGFPEVSTKDILGSDGCGASVRRMLNEQQDHQLMGVIPTAGN